MQHPSEIYNTLLKVNVLLLACMLEIFRKESIKSFELGPAHLSTPGYSLDVILRFTDVNLPLISDTEVSRQGVRIKEHDKGCFFMICMGLCWG